MGLTLGVLLVHVAFNLKALIASPNLGAGTELLLLIHSKKQSLRIPRRLPSRLGSKEALSRLLNLLITIPNLKNLNHFIEANSSSFVND